MKCPSFALHVLARPDPGVTSRQSTLEVVAKRLLHTVICFRHHPAAAR